MVEAIDQIHINFNPGALKALNILIGLIMFGVALEIKKSDFKGVASNKRAFLIGMFSQFIFFPFFSWSMTMLLDLPASIALGVILVASCPGGNLSNFLTSFSRGSTALSISMSSASTIIAIFMTPINIAFWGRLNPKSATILQTIHISPSDVLITVFLILIIPSALGISCAYYFPKLTLKIKKPFKYFGFICFVGFVAGAASMNKAVFAESVSKVFWIVLICNTSGLSFGYIVSRLFKLTHKDSIAVSFETGIQNTAFGLVLIFGFFGGLGGMAVVAAWYGIWHIITGLTLAIVFSRNETTLLPNTNSTVTT